MPAAPAVTRGDHFAKVSPGPPGDDAFHDHVFDSPPLPRWPGKVFFAEHAGGTGAEVSLSRLPAGAGVPFLHRHRRNDEWYLFHAGTGTFVVDGEAFPVGPGDAVRVAPAGARSLKADDAGPLTYWCVQVPAAGDAGRETADGLPARGEPPWA